MFIIFLFVGFGFEVVVVFGVVSCIEVFVLIGIFVVFMLLMLFIV